MIRFHVRECTIYRRLPMLGSGNKGQWQRAKTDPWGSKRFEETLRLIMSVLNNGQPSPALVVQGIPSGQRDANRFGPQTTS